MAKKIKKTLALIAHDGKKAEMISFVKDNIEFFENGDFVTTSYFEGCESESFSGTYTKSGTSLIVDDGFDETPLSIKELSSSTLKVYDIYSEDGETFTEITIFKRAN